MSRQEIKQKAKQQIKGHIWMFLLVNFIAVALSCVSYIPFVGALVLFIFYPFITINLYRVYQQFACRNVPPEPKALFQNFKEMWAKSWVLMFMMGLFVFLWSLLLIIPGIIKALSYAAAPYVLAANPELSGPEALNKSKEIMKGHKMDLFVFYLSFLGWVLLIPLTFGLILIWLLPYMSTAEAAFFANLGVVPANGEKEKAPAPKVIAEKVVEEVVEEVIVEETEDEPKEDETDTEE